MNASFQLERRIAIDHAGHHGSVYRSHIPVDVARQAASSGETLNDNIPEENASTPSDAVRGYIEASRRLRGLPQRSAGWKSFSADR